ncbi:DUF456 family protein [Synechococcus sp. RSCCF101]|uniref:DUF456 family protein n=1 Tax=Synechococcus sp. RSCCF101 TaxID=2511069 RepID=UPI00124701C4|nr:DUF456 family protein [Synechococcus sp. RSCCF101]QEY32851.1 DUF456 family protein [Synechococcus sp. RSCCF101]
MPSDPVWWLAVLIQALAVAGTLLPLLPGLVLLPLGALLWCWRTGWEQGWWALLLVGLLTLAGLLADLLALGLASARLQASRWAPVGAGIGLVLGVFGLLPALPVGGPLLAALVGPWLGAALVELWVALRPPQSLGGPAALRRGATVGLAVVAGLLVSKAAQLLLALLGMLGFVALTLVESGVAAGAG